MSYRFVKGHGTDNDFVILPDPDGSVHGSLDVERVQRLCDRRAGIGADGVLRVLRTEHAEEWAVAAQAGAAEWFMDYRNSDGSLAEMCGNGIRVFAQFLVEEQWVASADSLSVATRDGIKILTRNEQGHFVVDLGEARVYGRTPITAAGHSWQALHVSVGNPHAVCLVGDLAEAGPLLKAPEYDKATYPEGVNIEFITEPLDGEVSMRVYERGVGETRSCGTGAAAVAVAAAVHEGLVAITDEGGSRPLRDVAYAVHVPGGTLDVTWSSTDRVSLSGPAEIVASGTTDL